MSPVSLIEGGLRRAAENRIESAILEGAFDNLLGKGQPLPADRLYGVDPSWRLAFRVLDSAGFAPRWVELDQEISVKLTSAVEGLRRAAARTGRQGPAWWEEEARFESLLVGLNWLIREQNACALHLDWHRPALDTRAECESALARSASPQQS